MSEVLFEKISPYKNIIWDWNGTLIDDVSISDQILFDQLKRYNIKKLSSKTLRTLFCFPIRKFYQRVGFNLDEIDFIDLSKDYHHQYKKNFYKKAKLYRGTRELLIKLQKFNCQQFVLSAADEVLLKESITHFDLNKFFTKILGAQNHRGESKKNRGEELANEFDLKPTDSIMIGDSEHDLEVANFMGIHTLLIADGFQDYEVLSKNTIMS